MIIGFDDLEIHVPADLDNRSTRAMWDGLEVDHAGSMFIMS